MFLYGGDYNPEQWKEEKGILDEDLRLMEAAHINTVTLGVFAWSELEPREGEYDFSFFDETIDKLFKSGKKVILATPSGARPHWMAEKYPEVLRMQENGLHVRFGGRHNHCYTSPVYREKVRAIDGQLARRYAKHPAVIAWHISNEFSGECYCPLCCDAFRRFLRNRYGSIGALNRAYWSKFWSHTYDDFSAGTEFSPDAPGGSKMHGYSQAPTYFPNQKGSPPARQPHGCRRSLRAPRAYCLWRILQICLSSAITVDSDAGHSGIKFRIIPSELLRLLEEQKLAVTACFVALAAPNDCHALL